MNITECRADDVDALAELFDAYRRFYRAPADLSGARRFLLERLANEDSILLMARDSAGIPVGFAQLYPSFSSVRMVALWILNDLYVAPHARGQGIGRALMDAARARALEAGIAVLALATEKDNRVAKGLYDSCGYIRDTEFDHYELDLRGS